MSDQRWPGRVHPPHSTDRWDVLKLLIALAAVLVVAGYAGLFWLSGQLSGLLSGRGWPDSSLTDVGSVLVGALRHPGNPAQGWPVGATATVGPAWLVYGVFAAFVAPTPYGAIIASRFILNVIRRPEWRRLRMGFASRAEVNRLMSAAVVTRKAKVVRPSTRHRRVVDPLDVAFFLGRDIRSKQKLYASVEDVFIVLAPPRQGKDVHFCAPFTIDAPGACIVTSTRADAFTNTVSSRAKHGKIYVFDPNGLTHWPERMRWSPIRGCEEPLIAANRATAFVTGSGFKLGGEGAYWVGVAITILRCYLHAAALGGKTMYDVMRWSTQPSNPEPLTILRTAEAEGRAAPGWAGELEACAGAEPKFRSTMWATLAQAMSCFSDPSVLEICSPPLDEVFDLRDFLSGRNTMYILGKEKKNGSVAPVITAMMEDLFDGARKIASRMPGSRMDPPLTVELNEAAHIAPLPSLPAYMGDSGGFSIALHVYLQSLSQARSKWGEHEAMIMWDNAAVRIIMGGAGNVDDLDDISRLMGEIGERQTTRSTGPGGRGKSVSKVRRRVLSPEEVRTLPFGTAVIVARAGRPVEVKLTPWWKRKDGDRIAKGKAEIEKLILEYSDAAEQSRAHIIATPSIPAAAPQAAPRAPSTPPSPPTLPLRTAAATQSAAGAPTVFALPPSPTRRGRTDSSTAWRAVNERPPESDRLPGKQNNEST